MTNKHLQRFYLACIKVALLTIGSYCNIYAQTFSINDDTFFVSSSDIGGNPISLPVFDNDDLGTLILSDISLIVPPQHGTLDFSCYCVTPMLYYPFDFGTAHTFDFFMYELHLYDTISQQTFIVSNIVFLFMECENECIWPGDTDRNGVVDVWDMLPIGFLYGAVGMPRDFVITEFDTAWSWIPQSSQLWLDINTSNPLTFYDQINFSHADCNGDGIINDLDINIIDLNYGKQNGDIETYNAPISDNNFTLSVYIQNETVSIGDTVTALLSLDNPTQMPISGLALTLSHNVVDSNTLQITYPSTSFLVDNANIISRQYRDTESKVSTGIIRTNLQPTNSGGVFGVVTFVMEDVLEGKNEQVSLDIHIEKATIIGSNQEAIINIAPQDRNDDSVQIVGIPNTPIPHNISIQNNPIDHQLTINWNEQAVQQIALYDMNGRAIAQQNIASSQKNHQISLHNHAKGMYLLVIKTAQQNIVQKLMVF